jgi:iron complex transport system substrate-binding protein
MALCGGRNIFADLTAPAPVVSIEAVLARAPDVIVAADDGPDIAAFWARFAALPAARQRAFVRVDAAALNRPTPRLLDGAAALCAALQSR